MIGDKYIDLILRNLPLPALVLKSDSPIFTILFATESYLQISGRTKEELIGKGFFESYSYKGHWVLQEPLALKGALEHAVATMDKSTIDILVDVNRWNAEIIPVGDCNTEFLIYTVKEANSSEKDLELLMDNTEESFIQIGQELQILNYNTKFRDDFWKFFKREIHKGDSILNYALPGHQEMLEDIYARVFKGEIIEYEIEVPLYNEKKLVIQRMRYKPVYDSGKNVHSVFVTVKDITQEKKSQAAKEFERRDKEALINSTEDLIWSVSKTIKLVAANDTFIKGLKDLTGREFVRGDELLVEELFSEEYCNYWRGLYERALTGEKLVMEINTKDGDETDQVWFETTFNPIYKDENVVGIACFSRNISEKKYSQHQLIRTNARLKTAQKLAKIGYWEVDTRTEKLYWSDEVYKIWEVDPETFDVNFENLNRTVHPDDIKEFINRRQFALAKKQPFNFEHRIIIPDGSIKWIHETGDIVEENGLIIGFEGTVQDITESKLAEAALFQSNERYKYATRATFDAIWDWDLVTDNIYWGEGFEVIFGHKINTWKSDKSSWTNHIHPDDLERVMKGIYKVISSSKNNWSDEYWYLKANGDYAFVHDKGIVIRDEKNKAIRMIGAMHDLTQQKEEENRLRLLESVITYSNDAVMITEAEPINEPGPRIIFVNEAFSKMTGYSSDEVLGLSPRMFQGPGTSRKELDKLKKSIKKWQPCQIEVINYKKSGEEFWLNISVIPVADSSGTFTHLIAIQRDVTERRNYVEMLEKQNKALKDIAWTQSHVVRAPLARLMGLVSVIDMYPNDDINQTELLGHILRSAEELDEVVKLIISKAGKIESYNEKT